MQRDDEEQTRSWLLILVCLLFAAGFGFAGAVMGMQPVFKLATDHWESLGYAETMGEVLDVRINAGKDAKHGVNALRVLYTYTADGKTHQGTRLGVAEGFDDNTSNYQQNWASKLQRAMERGQKVPVFYSAKNPEEAMLDRDMRWGLFLGLSAIATIFPLLALALLWCANNLFVHGNLPFAALANVKLWRKQKHARKKAVDAVTPTVTPNPAVLGQQLRVSFLLPPAGASVEAMSTMSNRAEITIRCIGIPARGTDNPRRKIWAQRASDSIDHDGMLRSVEHSFLIPADLPPSSKTERETVRWEIQLIEPGTPDVLSWELQVSRNPGAA